MKVIFCSFCPQVVNELYLYCPYCGNKLQIKKDLVTMISQSLSPLEQQELNRHLYSLRKILCCLVLLEEELDLFLNQKDLPAKPFDQTSSSNESTKIKQF